MFTSFCPFFMLHVEGNPYPNILWGNGTLGTWVRLNWRVQSSRKKVPNNVKKIFASLFRGLTTYTMLWYLIYLSMLLWCIHNWCFIFQAIWCNFSTQLLFRNIRSDIFKINCRCQLDSKLWKKMFWFSAILRFFSMKPPGDCNSQCQKGSLEQ